ncbi:DMT family transporter [Cerasicoccus fimbriatus]|uniref:DMT family transporter n=1 Tax=Cerasicoccus fimbriatus TaxID=3014554 RepID=UPI0022B3E7F7|nr:DMT family transporter [Cerasicoccus sp. TK19100]
MPIHYILPAIAAALYALSSLFSKRALQEGAGTLRLSFMTNVAFFLAFAPMALLADGQPDWSQVHWPILAGTGFFIGHVLTFAAIKLGDVSVQAPMMGTKVVFVAAFSVIIGAGHVPLHWWIGAGLTAVAIFLLGFSDWSNRRAVWRTAVMALAASAVFGLTDAMVMKHAGAFGPGWFLATVNGVMLLESLLLIPFFEGGLRGIPKPAWKWLIGGSTLMAIQAVCIGTSIAFWGDATAVNIIYASRGLWGIVLVWLVGSWFGNREREAGGKVMGRRMAGAMMLVAAIILVLI